METPVKTPPPNPGSDDAVRQGCKCPRMDNARGAGFMGRPGLFAINDRCPLHGGLLAGFTR